MNTATQILKTRARALAVRPASAVKAHSTLDILEFRLAQERYAFEQTYVWEIHPLQELTPLPCTPPFLRGIVNVRGQILPVIDLKKFFDLPDTGITDLHVVIKIRSGGVSGYTELGILADSVSGISSIPLASLQPTLPTLSGIRTQYLKAVSDSRIVILDAARILADPKIVINEEIDS